MALTNQLLPMLLSQDNPTIINIGSPAGIITLSNTPMYSASKAGFHAYTKSLRYKLKRRAEVIEVFPASVATPMTADLNFDSTVSTDRFIAGLFKELPKNKREIWVGQSKIIKLLLTLLPDNTVFKMINAQV